MKATMNERPPASARAVRLGRKPNFSMASSTLRLVSSLTQRSWLSTRDAVFTETPASCATSRRVSFFKELCHSPRIIGLVPAAAGARASPGEYSFGDRLAINLSYNLTHYYRRNALL